MCYIGNFYQNMSENNNQNPFENTSELIRLAKNMITVLNHEQQNRGDNTDNSNINDNPEVSNKSKVSPETKNASEDTISAYSSNVADQIQKTEEAVQLGVRANAAALTAATHRATERQAGREQGKQAERERFSALEQTSKDISNTSISIFGFLSAIIINGLLMAILGAFVIPVMLIELFAAGKVLSQMFAGEKKTRDIAVNSASDIQKDLNIKPASEIGTHEFVGDRDMKSVLNPADANPVPSSIMTVTNVK